MLKNCSGLFFREKADFLFRDSEVFSFRYCHLLLGHDGALASSSEQTSPAFFLEAVTLALDVQGCRIVQETVEDGGCDDGIIERLPPIQEALVAGDNQAGPLIAAA